MGENIQTMGSVMGLEKFRSRCCWSLAVQLNKAVELISKCPDKA